MDCKNLLGRKDVVLHREINEQIVAFLVLERFAVVNVKVAFSSTLSS